MARGPACRARAAPGGGGARAEVPAGGGGGGPWRPPLQGRPLRQFPPPSRLSTQASFADVHTVGLAVRKTVGRQVAGRRSGCVVQVPAYFDPEQREATIAAGKLAGLETVRLVR